ncbi:MAG: CPBP family intramembrane metalloprotease [Methanomassiliicoccaceae archaeon]|jgi:hypothetical protein|nr:CPBP family intramembrane metalloprotease [Methanomassiliicoccaceae archaeon]
MAEGNVGSTGGDGRNEGAELRPGYVAPADPVPHKGTPQPIVQMMGVLLLIMCAAVLIFEIYTVFWGFGEIWSKLDGVRLGVLILTPSPDILMYLTGTWAKLYYLFIVVAVLVSFALLIYASRSGIKDLLRFKTDKIHLMPIYSVVTLFAAVIAFNIVVNMLITYFGDAPSSPSFGLPWQEQYSSIYASVWEEILCRMLMIGVPIAIYALWRNEKGSWKRIFGGFEMNAAAIVLILISSAIFAYAHVDGWDVYKTIPTFAAGLAMGYLFVKYGIYAPIMLHFLINYMSSFEWVLGDAGIILTGLLILATIVFGAVFFVVHVKHGLEYMKKVLKL